MQEEKKTTFKDGVKSFFGKASEFGKKAFTKSHQEEQIENENFNHLEQH